MRPGAKERLTKPDLGPSRAEAVKEPFGAWRMTVDSQAMGP